MQCRWGVASRWPKPESFVQGKASVSPAQFGETLKTESERVLWFLMMMARPSAQASLSRCHWDLGAPTPKPGSALVRDPGSETGGPRVRDRANALLSPRSSRFVLTVFKRRFELTKE